MRSNRCLTRSAAQRAWAGMFVQREFRSWQRPLAAASEDCLSEEQISLPRLQPFTPPTDARAVAELARGPQALSRRSSAAGCGPLRAPGRPCAIGSSARVGRGLCSARVPQLVVAYGHNQRGLSERGTKTPAPTTLATPTVPSQRCGPSCSPSPRGNGGRTRGRGSRSARARRSPGQSRPGRRSCWGC